MTEPAAPETTNASASKPSCCCRIGDALFGGMTPPTVLGDIGLTVLRVFAGLSMGLAHGYGKLPVSDQFVEGVAGMGFPMPEVFAWAAALAECVGGLLLAAGLLTRTSALFILGTMVVAAFITHGGDPFGKKEMALLYGCICIAFLFIGGGRFSIDFALRRRS